jgi:hypothetical protein
MTEEQRMDSTCGCKDDNHNIVDLMPQSFVVLRAGSTRNIPPGSTWPTFGGSDHRLDNTDLYGIKVQYTKKFL